MFFMTKKDSEEDPISALDNHLKGMVDEYVRPIILKESIEEAEFIAYEISKKLPEQAQERFLELADETIAEEQEKVIEKFKFEFVNGDKTTAEKHRKWLIENARDDEQKEALENLTNSFEKMAKHFKGIAEIAKKD